MSEKPDEELSAKVPSAEGPPEEERFPQAPVPAPTPTPGPGRGSISDEARAGLLMSHYDHTYEIVVDQRRSRDRLFLYVLILVAVIAVDCLSRDALSTLINGYVRNTLVGDKAPWKDLDFTGIIHLMVAFWLLSLVVKYYQRTILTIRMYAYLGSLETKICALIGSDSIVRHSKAYFSRMGTGEADDVDGPPLFLRLDGFVYSFLLPVALGALGVIMFLPAVPAFETLFCKLMQGACAPETIVPLATEAASGVFTAAITAYSLLYMAWVFSRWWHGGS